jgi:hypothetical protein
VRHVYPADGDKCEAAAKIEMHKTTTALHMAARMQRVSTKVTTIGYVQ